MEKNIKLYVKGRVGIIGETSDLSADFLEKNKNLVEGHAIAMPIDKGIYSNSRKSDKFIYKSQDRNFKLDINEENLNKEINEGSFYSYICGTILYLRRNYDVSGIEIEIEKVDVPLKKGFSSSAAICITIAKAYSYLYNLNLNDEEIKNIAYEGEHLAKSKCGRLDQETIISNSACHITFKSNGVINEKITVKDEVPLLAVDLNKQKNTKYIMNCFYNAFLNPTEENKPVIDIVNHKNKELVFKAKKALEEGNIKSLGECLSEAQKLMDNASHICKEYNTPTLHLVLEDEVVDQNIYGGKSIGSGGEGTLLLVCKNNDSQEYLKKYIKEKFKMGSNEFYIRN